MTDPAFPHVLVVEDDRDCAEELAELLECFGCKVTLAGSIAEARVARVTSGIRMAVVDLGLAGESGLDLALEWSGDRDVRVVVLSGRTLTPGESAAFVAGPPVVLLKPASGTQILQALGLPASA